MSKEAYKSGRVRGVKQDGSREFISLLAAISADGTALPPALIYEGSSNDLQSSWVEDLGEEDEAYFASSTTGWTNDALGLSWLRLFDRHTRTKGSRWRLLILDGHSSHINWGFISLADSLRILVLILPPHTTQRLQPLDVSLFSPLSHAYTRYLDSYTHAGQGWVSMTKRMFWPIFKNAWRDSFTPRNILSGFAKTGIWPLKAKITINAIQKSSSKPATPATPSTPPPLPSLPSTTPISCRAIRRLCKSTPNLQKLVIFQRIAARQAARIDIQNHELRNLRSAIIQEKKRRQRSKRLGLTGEEADSGPQFYSPQKVLTARAFQETKEAAVEEEKRQKALRKEEATRQRNQKLVEKQEAAMQRQLRLQYNRATKAAEKEQRAAEKAEKQRQKELDKQAKATIALQRRKEREIRKTLAAVTKLAATPKGRSRKAASPIKKPRKKPANPLQKALNILTSAREGSPHSIEPDSSTIAGAIDVAVEEPLITNSRGRRVVLPQRFKQ